MGWYTKHYLTDYEEHLLEYIGRLEDGIRSRNAHLVKANGYAPADPFDSDFTLDDRRIFEAKLITLEEFHSIYKVRRVVNIRGGLTTGGFLVMEPREEKNDVHKNRIALTVANTRELRDRAGGYVTGKIDEDKFELVTKTGETILLPFDIFSDIQPKYKPKLKW